MFCYSYRDPSPDASLKVYDGAADSLEEFVGSGAPLDKYIISTVSSGDPLQTPREEGDTADSLCFSGMTYEMRKKARAEMLSASPEALLKFADALRHMAKSGTVCVVGGEAAGAIEGLEVIDV